MNDSVVDSAELFLLGQRHTLHWFARIKLVYLLLELQPLFIARFYRGQPRHLIHDLIHLFLHGLGEIAIPFFALHLFQIMGQRQQERFYFWMFTAAPLHFVSQLQHGAAGLGHQLIPGLAFLLVDVEQLLAEDIVGEHGLDLLNTHRAEITGSVPGRPGHHVDVGMVALVMECGIPAELVGRDIHGGGDVVAVGEEQVAPRPGVIVAQTCGVLPLQRNDVRPHIFLARLKLLRHLFQIHIVLVAEQAVAAYALHARPGGDVLRVDVTLLNVRPVILQRPADERRGVDFGRAVVVAAVLRQLFCGRKIFCQFGDQQLLLFCSGTAVGHQLHPFPCGNVLGVTACVLTALEERAFQNQPGHSSSTPSSGLRIFSSKGSRPFVLLTLWTLSARRRRISSGVNS